MEVLLCTVELLEVFEEEHVEYFNVVAITALDEVEDWFELCRFAYLTGIENKHLYLLKVLGIAEVVAANEMAQEVEVAPGEELLMNLLVDVVGGVAGFNLSAFKMLEELGVVLEEIEEYLP